NQRIPSGTAGAACIRSPDAWLQSKPLSRREMKAWQTGGVHAWQTGGVHAWHFGMKAHIGVDAESGLVHTVIGTAANVNDVTQGHRLLHGEKEVVFADAGYQGANKRAEATSVDWHVAMRPGKRRQQKHTPWGHLTEQAEKLKASIRARVEHPFRVIKRQFGHTKVRYRGLKKNTAQLITLFALSNLWMARRVLMQRAQA
ncbi:MAG: transposase, partial [Polaromonas sp.]|nr:transposase [Polaromonas sp.]